MNELFPEKKGVNYDDLILTPEGEYSITKREDSVRIMDIMKSILGTTEDKHITDLTGNVGGDTIMFALNFDHVDSIEMAKDNYDALSHNINVYGLKNVTLHHGDSTKVFRWETDILYIDPPWGGPDYKKKKNLDLYLGKERLDKFLDTILYQEWRPKYVFLKLPRNYNFSRLPDNKKFRIRGYYLVYIKNGFL